MAVKNKITRNLFNINFSLLLIGFLLIYFLFLIKNDIQKLRSLDQEKQSITKQTFEQGKLKKSLYKKLELLKKDSYIKLLAREKLGLVEKGEKAYKVVK